MLLLRLRGVFHQHCSSADPGAPRWAARQIRSPLSPALAAVMDNCLFLCCQPSSADNAQRLLSEQGPQKDEEKSADAEDCIQSRNQGP